MRPRATLAALAAALALAGLPAQARKNGPPRTLPVQYIVIHSTGGPTCDARTGRPIWVSGGEMAENLRHIEAHPTLGIHYMIDRDGRVARSVPETQVAHHVFRYSTRSIAIELINAGDGQDPFPAAQIDALVALLKDIIGRHGLTAQAIVRHSDLDSGTLPCDPTRRRKVDPGAAYPHEGVRQRVGP